MRKDFGYILNLLSDEFVDQLCKILILKLYPKSYLVQDAKRKNWKGLFFIIKGTVDVIQFKKVRAPRLMCSLLENSFFGDECVLAQTAEVVLPFGGFCKNETWGYSAREKNGVAVLFAHVEKLKELFKMLPGDFIKLREVSLIRVQRFLSYQKLTLSKALFNVFERRMSQQESVLSENPSFSEGLADIKKIKSQFSSLGNSPLDSSTRNLRRVSLKKSIFSQKLSKSSSIQNSGEMEEKEGKTIKEEEAKEEEENEEEVMDFYFERGEKIEEIEEKYYKGKETKEKYETESQFTPIESFSSEVEPWNLPNFPLKFLASIKVTKMSFNKTVTRLERKLESIQFEVFRRKVKLLHVFIKRFSS